MTAVPTDDRLPEVDGAPLFLLDELPDAADLLVGGAEGRHAVDVLRLTPGERVRVGDGRGAVAEGEVVAAGPQGLRVHVSARHEVPPPALVSTMPVRRWATRTPACSAGAVAASHCRQTSARKPCPLAAVSSVSRSPVSP